jgi:hypothetical protein
LHAFRALIKSIQIFDVPWIKDFIKSSAKENTSVVTSQRLPKTERKPASR